MASPRRDPCYALRRQRDRLRETNLQLRRDLRLLQEELHALRRRVAHLEQAATGGPRPTTG